MPPSPVDGTKRWKVGYAVGSFEHEFLVRMASSAVETSVVTLVSDWLAAQTSLFFASVVTSVKQAAEDSNLFFPITNDLIGVTWGAGTNDRTGNPMQLNYVGRSSTGKRVRIGLFGYKGAFSDWRLTAAESTAVDNAVTALNTTTDTFIAIDGSLPVWYPYANVGANDYWLRQSRAG